MENLPGYRKLNKARKILGVPEIATLEQIKSAYHRFAMKYHPDRCTEKDKQMCTKKMTEVNRAYAVIMDYVHNYRYIFTEKAIKEQDTEYAVTRFFRQYKEGKK